MANAREKFVWDKHRDILSHYRACSVENGRLVDCPEDASIYFDTIQRVVNFLATISAKTRVLDVGCGVGLFSPLFANFEYTGVDQNELMIETARLRFPDRNFVLSNALELTAIFPPYSFDLLFTRAAVQHNTGPDKLAFIKQLSKVLVPNGLYVAVEDQFLIENSTGADVADYMSSCGWSLEEFVSPNYYVFRNKPLGENYE